MQCMVQIWVQALLWFGVRVYIRIHIRVQAGIWVLIQVWVQIEVKVNRLDWNLYSMESGALKSFLAIAKLL